MGVPSMRRDMLFLVIGCALTICLATSVLSAISTTRRSPSLSARPHTDDGPLSEHVLGGGPYGGSALSVVAVATTPTTVYASFSTGGVFASVDGGLTWTPADAGLDDDVVCELAADPSEALTLYATCNGGLYKTEDGGRAWRQLDVDDADIPVVAPSDSRVVYEPPEQSVIRSRDGGRTWELVRNRSGVRCVFGFAIDPTNAFVLYCAVGRSVYRSRDGGTNWSVFGPPLPAAVDDPHAIAIHPRDSQRIFVATTNGLYRFTEEKDWESVGRGVTRQPLQQLTFADESGDVLFANQGGNLLHSENAGRNWTVVWDSKTIAQSSFAVDPHKPSTVYVATDEGVFVTTNGGSKWTASSRGITRANAYVQVEPGPTGALTVTANGKSYRSTDLGTSWIPTIAAPRSGAVTDNGHAPVQLPDGRVPTGFAVSPLNPLTAYASTTRSLLQPDEIWRTDDGGTTWRQVDGFSIGSFVHRCSIIIDPRDDRVVYLIVQGVGIGGGGDLVRATTDGGLTWSAVPLPALSVAFVVLPGTLLAQVYNGSGNGLYRLVQSSDRGNTWNTAGTGLPSNVEVTNIVSHPQQTRLLFASTAGRGTFRSEDGGATWVATGRE